MFEYACTNDRIGPAPLTAGENPVTDLYFS